MCQRTLVGLVLFCHVTVVAESEQAKWFPSGLAAFNQHLRPFFLVNTYGLFRVMTTERNEIEIQVSDDGVFFQPLEFRWKPGDVKRAPSFVAPHQPRLDWQMWFAAFHPGFVPERDMRGGRMVWFGAFLSAILDRNETVLALVEPLPFPAERLKAVRAQFYRYRFTDWETRRSTGQWWTREFLGAYSPKFMRRDG